MNDQSNIIKDIILMNNFTCKTAFLALRESKIVEYEFW